MGETTSRSPDDVDQFREGMALLKANRLDEAIECFRRAATTGRDRPMEHYALAVALHRNSEFEKAHDEFSLFLEMSPMETQYVRQANSILPLLEEKIADQKEPPVAANPLAESKAYNHGIEAYRRGDLSRIHISEPTRPY